MITLTQEAASVAPMRDRQTDRQTEELQLMVSEFLMTDYAVTVGTTRKRGETETDACT